MLHTVMSLLDKYQLLGCFQLCLFLKSLLYNKRGLMMLFLKENCATGARNVRTSFRSGKNEGFWHNSESSKNGCWNERIPQPGSQLLPFHSGRITGRSDSSAPESETSPSVCSSCWQCPRGRVLCVKEQEHLSLWQKKGPTFFPFSFFCSCACCFNNEQLARNHSDQQPCDGFLMGFLITKGYKPVLQWDWICEVSTSLCQWWLVLSVHVLQWLLTVVRNSILVILFYSEPCELDRQILELSKCSCQCFSDTCLCRYNYSSTALSGH